MLRAVAILGQTNTRTHTNKRKNKSIELLSVPWCFQDVGLVPDMGQGGADDGHGGREARVMRYKAKRRSRLFSKKIRYEVRKLNAEKRPRMKVSFPLVVTAQ